MAWHLPPRILDSKQFKCRASNRVAEAPLVVLGDAEWEGEFREGKHNGSWNVMWHLRKDLLGKPVDFLKIGHHGSTNATPHPPSMRPNSTKPIDDGVYAILDTILPVPAHGKPTAKALVSTEREFYNPIPDCELLVDLARRVSNTRNYSDDLAAAGIEAKALWSTTKAKKNEFFDTYEKDFLGKPQPWRTDLESLLDNKKRGFVEIGIEPG